MGMWVPVHDAEWDGDVFLGTDRPAGPSSDSERGVVTFKGDTLPWTVGRYEVCCFPYHLVWSRLNVSRFAITMTGNTTS